VTKPPEHAEIDHEKVKDPFSRRVAITIVVVTLLAAVIEFAHAYNEEHAAASGREAQEIGAQVVTRQDAVLQSAMGDMATLSLGEEQRTREANATQQYLHDVALGTRSTLDGGAARLDITRWTNAADITYAGASVKEDGSLSPAADPNFPHRLLDDRMIELDRLRADQDAAAAVAKGWGDHVTQFAAVLTLTAVALYLLGLSLTIELPVRHALYSVGVGLAAVAVVATAVIQLTPPGAQPAAAATEYALGVKELRDGEVDADMPGLQAAVGHLRRAVQLRPGFARAHLMLATAEYAAGAPSPGAILITTSAAALAQSATEFEEARQLGLADPAVVSDIASVEFERFLENGDRAQLDASIRDAKAAQAQEPDNPDVAAGLVGAYIAAGRMADARASARLEMKLILGLHQQGLAGQALSAELTDLASIEKARPTLHSDVLAMKDYFVAATTAGAVDPPPAPSRGATISNISIAPAALSWSAGIDGLVPGRDQAAVEWYYRPSAREPWAALSAPSGTVATDFGQGKRAPGLGQQDAYLSVTGQCLAPGSYRLELYVNGRLAASRETSATPNAPAGHTLSDLGVDLCTPSAWIPGDRLGGYVAAFTSPDRKSGVYVYRNSLAGIGEAGDTRALTLRYLRQSVDQVGQTRLGATPTLQSANASNFMSLPDGEEDYYTIPGGLALAGAGREPDGSVLVAVVYGPSDQFQPGGQLAQVFASVVAGR